MENHSMETQWNHSMEKQISAKPGTGITEREHKACLGFGFFGAVFLQLINCPNEGGALIRSRS